MSEAQKSFSEEVTLNIRPEEKQERESKGDGDEEGRVIRRLETQMGLENQELHSKGNGKQSEGQRVDRICASDSALCILHPAVVRRGLM